MTTVLKCINSYREKYSSSNKVNKLWVCPDSAIEPKIGVDYTYSCALSTPNLPEALNDVSVSKHWVEDGTVCIIFKNSIELQKILHSA